MAAKTLPPPIEPTTGPAALIGPAELARIYGVPESSITKLLKAGALPAPVVVCGRIRRWNRQQVLQAIGGQ